MTKMNTQNAVDNILEIDPWLSNYENDLKLRMENYNNKREELLTSSESLEDFANAHHYYGFHHEEGTWIYREWAPNAQELFLVGDFNEWNTRSHPLKNIGEGDWVIELPEEDGLAHGQRVKVIVRYNNEDHYKLPLYIKRVVQETDEHGNIDWVGMIWEPEEDFPWTDGDFHKTENKAPFIYEAHVGLASEEENIGTYIDFANQILPRIKRQGYNTIQLMAIMQHPYYGSFGYHVSNFFAVSSWFGNPDELKYLVNRAHEMGIQVIMDIVHSHAVKNTNEGINLFDGTQEQFFYPGDRGFHPQWDSMLFNYGKNEVIHFLLSNIKYWMEEYHFDGFRFDGITSMLYWDHGLGSSFDSYDKYFSMNTNTDAVTYLMLASELAHSINENAILIAEDMSGMPGMCLAIKNAGLGFDYRLSMGIPDMWIKRMKTNDYDWDMNNTYYELTTHRPGEKKINYAESHDQSLVGDKTLFFWMADSEAYWNMEKGKDNMQVDWAIALHKMIRLITISADADGYLNFIGNEFGHPEWVDFPRQENNWSYYYCRRQWSLVDRGDLKYSYLNEFDKDMIDLMKEDHLMTSHGGQLLWIDQDRKIIAYRKNTYVFLFNFHPSNSYEQFQLPIHEEGIYQVIFSTDREEYGGYGRIDEEVEYVTSELRQADYDDGIIIYIPSRTGLVLKKIKEENSEAQLEEQALSQLEEAEKLAAQSLQEKEAQG